MKTEKQIQNDIMREFATRSDLRLWRANTGVARFGRRIVRFGVPGQADLTGILNDGRRLEIEVKSATGRQDNDQQRFEAMIKKFGGIYILARSVDNVLHKLKTAGYIAEQ